MESPQLALLVAHDHRRKGLMLVVGEGLGEEVHFLMKERLRLLAEGDLPPLRLLPQVDAPGEEREVLQLRHHRLRLDQPRLHLLEGVEDIVLRMDRGHLVDRAEGGGEEGVARQVDHRLSRQQLEERGTLALTLAIDRRQDPHPLHRLAGELTLGVEEADRLHLITDEVDPHRQVLRVGVDVDQTTADGKLPRHIDVVRLLEAQRPEPLAERLPLILLPERDVDMPRLILRLVGKALRQRRRIGNDDPWRLPATP